MSTRSLKERPRTCGNAEGGSEKITAIVSSAKADKDHPRKSVVRSASIAEHAW
jgi:hypothetical protein